MCNSQAASSWPLEENTSPVLATFGFQKLTCSRQASDSPLSWLGQFHNGTPPVLSLASPCSSSSRSSAGITFAAAASYSDTPIGIQTQAIYIGSIPIHSCCYWIGFVCKRGLCGNCFRELCSLHSLVSPWASFHLRLWRALSEFSSNHVVSFSHFAFADWDSIRPDFKTLSKLLRPSNCRATPPRRTLWLRPKPSCNEEAFVIYCSIGSISTV